MKYHVGDRVFVTAPGMKLYDRAATVTMTNLLGCDASLSVTLDDEGVRLAFFGEDMSCVSTESKVDQKPLRKSLRKKNTAANT